MGQLRLSAFAALGMLALALCTATAATVPARPPAPGVESIVHDANRILRAGDRIRVSARATAGGAATFDIIGVAADVGMRRTQGGGYGIGGPGVSGLYVGDYVVRPGDVARNAAVLATLAVGDREITAVGRQPVTIDARPPKITARIPAPGSTLENVRPNVLVALVDEVTSIDRSSLRLAVNGRDVTSRISVSGGWISYIPETPLPAGRNRVSITAADGARNVLKEEWAFQIKPPGGLITSVTTNPATPLQPGDVFSIVVTGTPGAQASFAIGNPGSPLPMREARPGQYVGSAVAAARTSVIDDPITATLVRGNVRHTMRASVGLTVLARSPSQPTIDAPRAGATLGSRVLMRGRGPAGYVIEARISYSGPGQRQGVLAELTTVAGKAGIWSFIVDPLVSPDDSRVVVSVTAIDPEGQRSSASTREFSAD
jgi:hypothetical protein